MEKIQKFFIITLVAGLVGFSSVLAMPTQVANAVKLVTVERHAGFIAPAHSNAGNMVKCNNDEVVTGGGFYTDEPKKGTVTFYSEGSISNNAWGVAVYNPTDVGQLFIASAICAKLAPGQ
jgi:hypothetical protein